MKLNELEQKVVKSKLKALEFCSLLKSSGGYKYTINHDEKKFPVALLYGTWSVAYIKKLVLGKNWIDTQEKQEIIAALEKHRTSNGLFYPKELNSLKFGKSTEYMQLHCYNYSVGAALEIDSNFDFQSKYMDYFLDSDFLIRWLNQRSLLRPWEESNNIVNVAGYLALCNDNGNSKGSERLYEMLDWHNKNQNPLTGGFENFTSLSKQNKLQSMAGAVHNFHLHHYLNVPTNFDNQIAKNIIPFLFEGPLTACLSIDFVELACNCIKNIDDTYELEQALLFHLNCLLEYQNEDGGWYENETKFNPTIANGMSENIASSNSYATWFRLTSIAMIRITLFGDSQSNWSFRKTLGMGYVKDNLSQIKPKKTVINKSLVLKYKIKNTPSQFKKKAIKLAVKLLR
jgi:hypothetical protein